MIGSGKAEKKAARNARLSAALRENLRRRKAKARGLGDSAGTPETAGRPGGSAPEPAPDFRRNRGRE